MYAQIIDPERANYGGIGQIDRELSTPDNIVVRISHIEGVFTYQPHQVHVFGWLKYRLYRLGLPVLPIKPLD